MTDIDKSLGNQNRHSFWCDDLEQRRMYGGCLYLVEAYKAQRISASDPLQNCAIAMSKGKCNAFAMREEEIQAGRSLYYVDAKPKLERINTSSDIKETEGYQRGWNQVGRSMGEIQPVVKRQTVTPIKKLSEDDLTVSGGFDIASIISNEVKKANSKSQVTEQIQKIKREIVTLIKTDPKRAKQLLDKAKQLEISIT
jgi:hypothetical protein